MGGKVRPVDSGLGVQAPPARAVLMGALGSAKERSEARDGTMSTSRGGRRARRRRWDCRSKEQEAWVGTHDGQEREANITGWGACGRMAVVANAEWGGRTAAQRRKACNGRASG
jgi:hypothetical protein